MDEIVISREEYNALLAMGKESERMEIDTEWIKIFQSPNIIPMPPQDHSSTLLPL